MTSNFISNIGNFDKYNELYGLTGTLGSYKSKKFLKDTYKVELFKVPPLRKESLRLIQEKFSTTIVNGLVIFVVKYSK